MLVTGFSDYGISEVAHNCPELQTLSLANCDSLTGASIIQLAVHCPKLSTVDLTGCTSVQVLVVKLVVNIVVKIVGMLVVNQHRRPHLLPLCVQDNAVLVLVKSLIH
jgi:hypothetical protein